MSKSIYLPSAVCIFFSTGHSLGIRHSLLLPNCIGFEVDMMKIDIYFSRSRLNEELPFNLLYMGFNCLCRPLLLTIQQKQINFLLIYLQANLLHCQYKTHGWLNKCLRYLEILKQYQWSDKTFKTKQFLD